MIKLNFFLSGEMISIKNLVREDGTTITVSNLFYNLPERRADIQQKSRSDYDKIVEVMRKYAILCNGCSFHLESDFSKFPDIETSASDMILHKISKFYGKKLADNLITVGLTNETYNFQIEGLVNNTVSILTKYTFILFINNRLVDCEPLKKKLLDIYALKLLKGHFPFIFLSIQINPSDIDVNRNPSKREVRYLHEDAINDKISEAIEMKLVSNSGSRPLPLEMAKHKGLDNNVARSATDASPTSSSHSTSRNTSPNMSHNVSLDASNRTYQNTSNLSNKHNTSTKEANQSTGTVAVKKVNPWKKIRNDPTAKTIREAFKFCQNDECVRNADGSFRLKTDAVDELIATKNEMLDPQLTNLFRRSTYVGLTDRRCLLIQYDTKLIMFRYKPLW